MINDASTFNSDSQAALWQRLCAHPFETSGAELDFTSRLAREQAWSHDRARAAIEEYRRFCFLAVTSDRLMVPSATVDQVWHLHLTYTRDYWTVFCPLVLGCNLHHEPTRGNPGEARAFREQYADTLAAYYRRFGPPPANWWPSTRERFAAGRRYRWVDREREFVLPRPRLPSLPLRIAALCALLLLILAPLARAGTNNPLDWAGGPFLVLYLVLMGAAIPITHLWRNALRDNGAMEAAAGLDTWDIAYLAGGRDRVTDAAVADLMKREIVRWDTASKRLVVTDAATNGLPALLGRIVQRLRLEGRPVMLAKSLDVDLGMLRSKLEQRGLLLDADAHFRAAWLPILVPAALVAFGAVKLYIGWVRDKPVTFLLILMLLVAIASAVAAAKVTIRSRAGDRALKSLMQRHAHTARAPRLDDLPLAVALAGTMALSTTAYAAYHQARAPSSSGSDGSSSGGDSSGCGGGSGCGGCGGGGD